MDDSKLGKIGDLSKKIGGSIQKSAEATKKVAKQQIGIEQVTEKDQKKNAAQLVQTGDQKDQSEEIVKALYEKTDPKLQTPQAQVAKTIAQQNPQKSAEEIKKMTDLRMKLHQEYYESTFNPPKKPEEKPAERVERLEEEEKKKRWELAKKEEKKKPIAVDRAEHKIEKFRGAAG